MQEGWGSEGGGVGIWCRRDGDLKEEG